MNIYDWNMLLISKHSANRKFSRLIDYHLQAVTYLYVISLYFILPNEYDARTFKEIHDLNVFIEQN